MRVQQRGWWTGVCGLKSLRALHEGRHKGAAPGANCDTELTSAESAPAPQGREARPYVVAGGGCSAGCLRAGLSVSLGGRGERVRERVREREREEREKEKEREREER